ncbi:hypothetical protein CPB84DRAFT_1795112 [Gymnopilus junonius]|uniref:Uncharacterized protein n=1 Tax=Gymnopilus junonius TaxID=109634 RepID=A0A9P5TI01_GYMJU|nr:hypothetical protein CPB84DRAFT_1795112 [Gymnopilus junonius]
MKYPLATILLFAAFRITNLLVVAAVSSIPTPESVPVLPSSEFGASACSNAQVDTNDCDLACCIALYVAKLSQNGVHFGEMEDGLDGIADGNRSFTGGEGAFGR